MMAAKQTTAKTSLLVHLMKKRAEAMAASWVKAMKKDYEERLEARKPIGVSWLCAIQGQSYG